MKSRLGTVLAFWWFPASLCVVLAFARTADAQGVSGAVSDSATRLPVPGAVVVLLDSAGGAVARTITNARGEYHLSTSPLARRVRIVRMGFRPRDVPMPFMAAGAVVNVSMTSIPTMLEQVRVVAGASCPRRSDRQAALALLEQARAGLLNAVVAREANPASITILPFERVMEDATDRIEHQKVRIKSSDRVTTSFQAVRAARQFVQDGFVSENGDELVYYGPDADVLLDEGFASGYCFHLREPDRGRANQVGLAFVPARRHPRRVDIDGTLWIDTAARKLHDVEYRYLGLPSATGPVKPGGQASFWELPNGIVFIDKWSFRLPVARYDTTSFTDTNHPVVKLWYAARETGGEVATSSWPDGQSYQGPLGILNARAVNSEGTPVTGIVVRLDSTDYVASPDSLGFFEMTNLLPGPYTAVVVHPEVAHLGILLPTSLRFVAVRDSIVQESMWVPNPRDYVRVPCPVVSTDYLDDPLLMLRIQTPDKKPVAGAHWQLRRPTEVPGHWVTETRTTDADGRARHCMHVQPGDELEIHVWREHERPKRFTYKLPTRPGTNVRLVTLTLPLVPATH